MGKRSEFKRIEKDAYQTIDKRAVASLLPFLKPSTRFAEPCVGEGKLKDDLTDHGHVCVYSSDINHGVNALDLTSQEVKDAYCIITNPPWSRHIMHPLIECMSALKPTWLLFDADWAHTKQSSLYVDKLCTDIVSVGRLIWIPGTTVSGKDNCAWYRFSVDKTDTTRFHGR